MNWRAARVEDALIALPLIYATMGTFADFLFGVGSSALARRSLEVLFRHPRSRLSHAFTQLLDIEEETAGLYLAYPGALLPRLDLHTAAVMFPLLGWRKSLAFISRAFAFSGVREAHPGEYYIQALAVTPSRQGMGLGKAILEHAAQTARALGLSALSLLVSLDNLPAQNLYLNSGFEIAREMRFSRLERETGIPGFWRMVKRL